MHKVRGSFCGYHSLSHHYHCREGRGKVVQMQGGDRGKVVRMQEGDRYGSGKMRGEDRDYCLGE